MQINVDDFIASMGEAINVYRAGSITPVTGAPICLFDFSQKASTEVATQAGNSGKIYGYVRTGSMGGLLYEDRLQRAGQAKASWRVRSAGVAERNGSQIVYWRYAIEGI